MKRSYFAGILATIFLIIMLVFSDCTTAGARYGLLLWYHSVVPALFPFMVLSSVIVSSGGISIIMSPFYQLLKQVLPISKDGCYVLVSGLVCGYPMGAKTCADFVQENRISLQEGRFLMAVCNHPSPMFLLGYVYPFFSRFMTPATLLMTVYLPLIPLALAAKYGYFHHKKSHQEAADNAKNPPSALRPVSPISTDQTILNAVEILCKIGGYLVLFSIAILLLKSLPWIPQEIRLLFVGTLEMTTAVRELSSILPYPASFIASAAALTFGGISGLFQTKAVLRSGASPGNAHEKKAGLSIRPYVFWKLAHAALAALCAYVLCIILPARPLFP